MAKLTPLDIRKQEFPQRFRGYDPEEVDTFLDLIADDAESLTLERNQLQERSSTLESQLAEFKEIERSLRDALVMAERMQAEASENAQRRIESMLREAEVKSYSIIGEAEAKGRDIILDAENRRRALLLELEALDSQRAYALSKFRSLLDEQRSVLEVHLMSRPGSANLPGPNGSTLVPPRESAPSPQRESAPARA
ncbi:MAG: DivIVA domain-containing protein [Candidatus Eisenbacteria bacterium]|nr:DivIVA domain-containing protein [Candidatus Eisenbacteria bacterium]